jgi:CHASE2 domain-containing sensor protein
MNPTGRYAHTRWVPSPQRKLAGVIATPALLLASLASLTVTTTPLLFLFWLMQPAARANPGVSAYIPPPGARVERIAHTVESRDPPTEFSAATNFARDYTRSELIEDSQPNQIKVSLKHEARPSNRKQFRVGYTRKHKQSARAYAQEWDNQGQPFYR